MFNLIFVSMIVLCCSTVPGKGQSTISSCKDSDSDADENLMEHLRSFEEKSNLMYLQLQMMNQSIEGKFQTMSENFISQLQMMNELLNSLRNLDLCRGNIAVCDCSTIRANGFTTSGVYRIYVDHQNERHYANAFCDMTTENSGWTVFQRRKDGSVDFYREWKDYANGFGNPNGEYWLGNEFLHMLTSKRRYRLRIDLEDFEGGKRFAEYSTFNINSAADKYRLRIGTYSGNAGDSLSYHNGYQFSTKDQDNDADSSNNCALSRWAGGAWWYNSCYESNLNGFYYRTGNYSCSSGCWNGTEWNQWRGYYSLKSTEMKIAYY